MNEIEKATAEKKECCRCCSSTIKKEKERITIEMKIIFCSKCSRKLGKNMDDEIQM